ncbi:MAG TPA: DUF3492 domain-containing protein [Micromonosporaceae bacterium]|nr:DUF3492 domain-containing protein [Micromonosporaceae bacterium]
MRVALISDGTYPFRQSVTATWCHRLVRGMSEHRFHIVAVGDRVGTIASYAPTSNTDSFTSVGLAGAGQHKNRRTTLAQRRLATHASVLLCRGMVSDTPHGLAMVRSALRRLAAIADAGTDPLEGVPIASVLFDAWRAAGGASNGGGASRARARNGADGGGRESGGRESGGRLLPARIMPARIMPARIMPTRFAPTGRHFASNVDGPPRSALPQPTRDDARRAAELLHRALRVMTVRVPVADLNHAIDAGTSALLALTQKWRTGTPFVLTEHDTYLNATLLSGAADRPAVRAVLLRLLRAVARLCYDEAASIAAPSERLRRWAVDHGGDPAKISLIGYGVDPHSCPPLRGEPSEPTVLFLGPERDVVTMLGAVATLRAARLDIRLIVAGPADDAVHRVPADVYFLGPVSHRRSAYATGQVVVISGRDPAAPYAIVEAMMCGRPTICLDDGTFEPVVGTAVMVVPYDDRARLADACAALLGSPDRRRDMSTTSARRARSLFALRTTTDAVRLAYERAMFDAVRIGPLEPGDDAVAAGTTGTSRTTGS